MHQIREKLPCHLGILNATIWWSIVEKNASFVANIQEKNIIFWEKDTFNYEVHWEVYWFNKDCMYCFCKDGSCLASFSCILTFKEARLSTDLGN